MNDVFSACRGGNCFVNCYRDNDNSCHNPRFGVLPNITITIGTKTIIIPPQAYVYGGLSYSHTTLLPQNVAFSLKSSANSQDNIIRLGSHVIKFFKTVFDGRGPTPIISLYNVLPSSVFMNYSPVDNASNITAPTFPVIKFGPREVSTYQVDVSFANFSVLTSKANDIPQLYPPNNNNYVMLALYTSTTLLNQLSCSFYGYDYN